MSLLTSTLADAGLALGLPSRYEPWEAYGGSLPSWGTANLALFLPVGPFPAPFRATGVRLLIDETGSGNVDVAIVTVSGTTATRIGSSGSTVITGGYLPETVSLTSAVVIPPGRSDYYLGIAMSSDSTAVVANAATEIDLPEFMVAHGQLQKASSFPIAASTTSLVATTATFFPWFQLIRG